MGYVDHHRLPKLLDLLKAFSHSVKGQSQLANFILRFYRDLGRIVTSCNLSGNLSHLDEWIQNSSHNEKAESNSQHKSSKTCPDEIPVNSTHKHLVT